MEKERKLITRREFEDKLIEICYDRDICHQIGVDYVRMGPEDLMNIRRYLLTQYNVKPEKMQ